MREAEENAACVEVGGLEGVGVGLDLAVHPADHRKGAGDFLEDLLGETLRVLLPGCLMRRKKAVKQVMLHNLHKCPKL